MTIFSTRKLQLTERPRAFKLSSTMLLTKIQFQRNVCSKRREMLPFIHRIYLETEEFQLFTTMHLDRAAIESLEQLNLINGTSLNE
jgi:hypothetical protein